MEQPVSLMWTNCSRRWKVNWHRRPANLILILRFRSPVSHLHQKHSSHLQSNLYNIITKAITHQQHQHLNQDSQWPLDPLRRSTSRSAIVPSHLTLHLHEKMNNSPVISCKISRLVSASVYRPYLSLISLRDHRSWGADGCGLLAYRSQAGFPKYRKGTLHTDKFAIWNRRRSRAWRHPISGLKK